MSSATIPELILYQYGGLEPGMTLSPPCGKVHMALAFKGLSYRTRTLTTPLQVRRVNPRGRVPALRIGSRVVVDSSDILSELDLLAPSPPLLPAGPYARARAQILEDWADEVLYFYLVYLRWLAPEGFRRFNERVLTPTVPLGFKTLFSAGARFMVRRRLCGQGVGLKSEGVVRAELGCCLDALDALLAEQSGFVVGSDITRADISLLAVIEQLDEPRLDPGASEAVRSRPSITAWRARLAPRFGDAG